MTSESKILTVSYGTFSCTLEGFDDPFNTMKAIAEYFRDLAGDDRYFGAEPPQPDAAMLHRIAEREVSRLVDSRTGDNSVTLRPQGDAAQPSARVTTQRPAHDLSDLAAKAQAAAAVEDAASEPTLQDVIPSGVAAKLARIRQSVNPPFVPASVAEAALDALAADDAATPETAFAAPEADAVDTDDVLSRLGALMNDPAEPAEPALDAATPVDNAFGDVFESDAAPMIEDATAEDVDTPVEADVVDAQIDNWLARRDAEVEEAPVDAYAADVAVDAAVAEATPEAFPEADVTEDVEGQALEAAAFLSATDDTPPQDAPDYAQGEDALVEDLTAESMTLDEALAADPLPEDDLQSVAPESYMDAAHEATAEDAALEATAEPEIEAPAAAAPSTKSGPKTKRVSSRVVRIHPDDDGDEAPTKPDPNATRMLDGSGDDDFARLLRQADDVMSDEENRRRFDSISRLKAAVVATEADRAAGSDAKPEAKQDPYRDDLAQVVQPEPTPAPTPEVRPRRKTISVRPQEPRPGTIRPGMVSPPPLVLVSEQRIDRVPTPAPAPAPVPVPAPAHALSPGLETQPMVGLRTGRLTGAIGASAASPVSPHQKLVLEQPSRSASADTDEEDDLHDDVTELDEAGLVRFAQQVGVKSMVDMLEAAAAYATCIENRHQFTRPQLMRRLMASAGGSPVSREDGLRSFGTLLRTGRIEKVSRGFYVLAEHSPYLAEARRMA